MQHQEAQDMKKLRLGAVETPPASEENFPPAIESSTLTGDLRDLILDTLRYEQDKRPWHERSEKDQHATIDRVERAVHEWVQRAVELVAAEGRAVIKATVAQVVIKDGIKAVLTLSQFDALRHALVDAQGKAVLLVVADAAVFEGERAPVPVVADQSGLPMSAHADTD